MDIIMEKVTVGEVYKGFVDNDVEGVVGLSGKLNIRPAFQREFIYKPKQQEAVIRSILAGFPLNTMYWTISANGNYELLDGQQRTLSFCKYLAGEFSVDYKFFMNLSSEEKRRILDYELQIYICEGTAAEKLDWFKTINIAGLKLTDQELRNAVYAGPWLTSAKKKFSKPNNPAEDIAKRYLRGSAIRQDYLENAIKWISKGNIEDYMARHQHDPNANQLWRYFESVISWVEDTFPTHRKEMKGVDWGPLYDKYHDQVIDTKALEEEISKLMMDEDVTKKSGIYYYVFDHDPKHLHIRAFTPKQKREAYERQKGICAVCGEHFKLEEMEADHITPWSEGGATTSDNCQLLCRDCNRKKGNK